MLDFHPTVTTILAAFRFLALIGFVFITTATWANDDLKPLSKCVTDVTVLPLLGGVGDAPLIPARIEGHDVAMYVDFAFTGAIWLRRGDHLPISSDGPGDTILENGDHSETVTRIMLDDFAVGSNDFGLVPAYLMPGYITQSVDGRPIAGVLGHDMFEGLQVILDMPHRRIVSFSMKDSEACAKTVTGLLGDTVYGGKFTTDDAGTSLMMPIVIDGRERDFYLDFDMSNNIVPRTWTDLPEIAAGEMNTTNLIITHYSGSTHDIAVGKRVVLDDVRIAGQPQSSFSVLVENRTQTAMIGTSFFANHTVLLDYPNQRFWFADASPLTAPAGHDLHFEENIDAHVTVLEKGRR